MRDVDKAGGPTAENLRDVPVPDAPEALVKATEELIATSLLLGVDHASGALNLADGSFDLPFEEAASFLRGRVPLTKKEWGDLEPKLRFRAFTVAALSSPDAVEKVRQQAINAIEKGTPLSEFWTAATAEGAAGIGDSPWYWETVYRTNVQTAYNAGRAIELRRNQPEYLEFVGIGDVRQTPICRSRSGTILPATHPFWKVNWPPLHFNCRSTVRAVYQEEVDALRATDPNWKPSEGSAAPGEVPATGFGGNPVDEGSFWKMTQAMKDRAEKLGIMGDIERLASDLGIAKRDIEIIPPARRISGKGKIPASGASKVATPAAPISEPQTAPVIPDFKTVKEVERWVMETGLADACSFKGTDIRIAASWAQSLQRSIERFPSLRNHLQFVGTTQERNRLLSKIVEDKTFTELRNAGIDEARARSVAKKQARNVAARWRTSSATIAEYCCLEGIRGVAINERFAKSAEAYLEQRKMEIEHGWKPAGTEQLDASLQHELGHVLDDITRLGASEELRLFLRGYTSFDIEKGLSGYGASSYADLIAEAWSEYQTSPAPRELASKIAAMLIRILKEKK